MFISLRERRFVIAWNPTLQCSIYPCLNVNAGSSSGSHPILSNQPSKCIYNVVDCRPHAHARCVAASPPFAGPLPSSLSSGIISLSFSPPLRPLSLPHSKGLSGVHPLATLRRALCVPFVIFDTIRTRPTDFKNIDNSLKCNKSGEEKKQMVGSV